MTTKIYRKPHLFLAMMLGVCTLLPQASKADGLDALFSKNSASASTFLPVHEAFKVKAAQKNTTLTVHFDITPEHYVYQQKLKLTLPEGVQHSPWQFSHAPTMVEDPEFGRVPVFDKNVTATTTLSGAGAGDATIVWQGCAKKGLCYPPERVKMHIDGAVLTNTKGDAQKLTEQQDKDSTQANHAKNSVLSDIKSNVTNNHAPNDAQNTNTKNADAQSTSASDSALSDATDLGHATSDGAGDVNAGDVNAGYANVGNADINSNVMHGDPENLVHHTDANDDPFGFSRNPMLAVFLLFLAGLLLAFTACVYPMIPIVANIVARQHNPTPTRAFLLTTSYALGVATSYGLLGVAAAVFGRSLGIIGWLQNPYVLLGFAGVFILLALYMLDVFSVQLPAKLRNHLGKASSMADNRLGSFFGSYMVGALSSLVVSPCVSAPLGGALLAISVIGSAPLGFIALFALGLGITTPLIVMGSFQGKFMPKSGAWMQTVKHIAALMLFAVALVLAGRVITSGIMLLAWAFWLFVLALYLFNTKKIALQAMSFLATAYALTLVLGFAQGSNNPIAPLKPMTYANTTQYAQNNDLHITTLEQLDAILLQHDKVLVDVTAEWCIECKIMKKTLFADRPAKLQDWQVVFLDITESTDDSKAILERYELFGPPSLLFYTNQQLQNKQIGEVSRHDFEQILTHLH